VSASTLFNNSVSNSGSRALYVKQPRGNDRQKLDKARHCSCHRFSIKVKKTFSDFSVILSGYGHGDRELESNLRKCFKVMSVKLTFPG